MSAIENKPGCWIVVRYDKWRKTRFIVHRAASELLANQWSNANPAPPSKFPNEVEFSARAVLFGSSQRRQAKYQKLNPDQGKLL
jgi:hypothetical protein